MSLSINQNIMAMNSYRNLSLTQGGLSKSLEKLSSGFRINRAADDAAGLAISEGLRSQVGGNKQAVRNAQDGISVVQTAEGALNEVHSILQRMRTLAVQGANDSNSSEARNNINTELVQLRDELERIGNVTNFNGTKLLDGTASGSSALKFQVGANGTANDRITVDLKDADVKVISDFNMEKTSSNVMSAKAEGLAANAKYTLDLEGKLITIDTTGATTDKAMQEAVSKALAEANASAFVEGGEPSVLSKDVQLDNTKAGNGTEWTLSIAGKEFKYTTTAGATTTEQIAQELNQQIERSTLKGQYSITMDGNKFKVEALGEAANKQVAVKLSTTATNGVVPDAAFADKTAGTIIDTKVGKASGGDFKFTVTKDSITIARTDGKAIDVDLSHALSKHGNTPGTGDTKVELKALDAKGAVITADKMATTGMVNTLTVIDHDSAQELIKVLDGKIQSVSTARANLGAVQNRFEHTINNLNVAVENLSASESRIRDTDMAEEMMAFTRNQILSQAGTSMLAQANQVPQTVLSLLR